MMLISSSHLNILKIDLNLRHLLIHILATEACDDYYDFKTQRSMRDTPVT
jgi:hypothetical protein